MAAVSDNFNTSLERAVASGGVSSSALHNVIQRIVGSRCPSPVRVLDVGCGQGLLAKIFESSSITYVGTDVLRFPNFPEACEFSGVDLDVEALPFPGEFADVVIAVGLVEYLENPRHLFRELSRCCRRNGLVVVSTPNQLSLLSKTTLMLRNQFNAFQENDGHYPAGRTALLETDLIRIARECGLSDIQVHYESGGRIPGTGKQWPAWTAFQRRAFCDDVVVSAVRRRD